MPSTSEIAGNLILPTYFKYIDQSSLPHPNITLILLTAKYFEQILTMMGMRNTTIPFFDKRFAKMQICKCASMQIRRFANVQTQLPD